MPTQELTAETEADRFHRMIAGHPDLRVVSVDPESQSVTFIRKGTDKATEISRLPEQLAMHGADVILAILEGREKSGRITHITRIVGYFSRVREWNRSKLAELRARRRRPHRVPTGNYHLGGRSDSAN
jgi:hypothetical protein